MLQPSPRPKIDLTLCDLVADLRAPTPSAAAELAAGEWRAWAERLGRDRAGLAGAYRARLGALRAALERRDPTLSSPRLRLQRLTIVVDRAREAMVAGARERCHGRGTVLARLETRLARCAPQQRLVERAAHLAHLTQRLQGAVRQGVARRRQVQERWQGELGALSPLAVLERGYALVRTPAGALVRDAAKLSPGCGVTVRLTRGELDCTVDAVHTGGAGERGDA